MKRNTVVVGVLGAWAVAGLGAAHAGTVSLMYSPSYKSGQLQRKFKDVKVGTGQITANGVMAGVQTSQPITQYVANALQADLQNMGIYDANAPLFIEGDIVSFTVDGIGGASGMRFQSHVNSNIVVSFRIVDRASDKVLWEDKAMGGGRGSESNPFANKDNLASKAIFDAMQQCMTVLWQYDQAMDILASGSNVQLASSLTHKSQADAFFGGKSPSQQASTQFAREMTRLGDELATALAQKGGRVRVAVAPFDSKGAGSETMGAAVTEELITRLAAGGKVDVMERAKLDKVMSEQSFSLGDLVAVETAVQIGKMLAVQAIVTGTVMDMGQFFQINARAIDVESGRVLSAGSASIAKM
jgi:TolB-like protein